MARIRHRNASSSSGNVLFYVFIAIGLLAALSYSFVKGSRENFAAQNAVNIAEALFSQSNMVRSAVQQCIMEYPEGGAGSPDGGVHSYADLNRDGTIDSTNDNPNIPYPLEPNSALNPNAIAGFAAAGNNYVRNLTCVGAPAAQARMFSGTSNQGRFLPPPPPGFPEWTYANDTDGVYIRIIAPNDSGAINAMTRLRAKFNTCQAELNFGGCGTSCITIWLNRVTAAACL